MGGGASASVLILSDMRSPRCGSDQNKHKRRGPVSERPSVDSSYRASPARRKPVARLSRWKRDATRECNLHSFATRSPWFCPAEARMPSDVLKQLLRQLRDGSISPDDAESALLAA